MADDRKIADLLGADSSFECMFEELDKLVEECDNEVKLAVTRWVMKNIVEHAQDGGSYRYLIYERLGFGPEAYGALLNYGMTISNEFNLSDKENIRKLFQIIYDDKKGDIDHIEKQFEMMKPEFNICDEPGCSNEVSCGWPSENGEYRRTCGKHYQRKIQ